MIRKNLRIRSYTIRDRFVAASASRDRARSCIEQAAQIIAPERALLPREVIGRAAAVDHGIDRRRKSAAAEDADARYMVATLRGQELAYRDCQSGCRLPWVEVLRCDGQKLLAIETIESGDEHACSRACQLILCCVAQRG